MTLAELLPAIQQLSAIEKLKLIRILVEDLDVVEDIAPLEPFKTYELPTPYDSFGAGAVLSQANFFLEFDICFYRSKLEFEIEPKS